MILETITKWFMPVLGSAMIGILTYIVKSNHAMKISMVLLLRAQIVGKCEKHLEAGYLPDYARNCLEDLFNQYKVLHGNHGVGKLVDQCFELPPILKERKEI
jgi:hypothetical protein